MAERWGVAGIEQVIHRQMDAGFRLCPGGCGGDGITAGGRLQGTGGQHRIAQNRGQGHHDKHQHEGNAPTARLESSWILSIHSGCVAGPRIVVLL